MEDQQQQEEQSQSKSKSKSNCLTQQQYNKCILEFLDGHNVEYKTVHHEETFTSEESSRVRGVPLSTGGKALLLKVSGDNNNNNNNKFSLFVMSASRKLHSKAIKKELKGTKNIRFATREELADITGGLVPGCVPPFGKPILKYNNGDDEYLELYVDTSIAKENEIIAFNAGSLTDSVIMSVPDYLRISAPTKIFTFSKS